MTRYFMTTSEATQLVLSAAAMAVGGETFVLDMGEPVNIDALARRMIALAGLRSGEDVEIRYTGLRPGEKLSEARLTDMPGLEATACPFIFAGREAAPDADAFLAELDRLQVLAAQPEVSRAEIAAALQTIVPEFCRERA